MNKSLIVITGLEDNFNKVVAGLLCKKLGTYFLDVKNLLEYELANKDEIIFKCGVEHFKDLEQKTIKSVAGYENTVAVIGYDVFLFEDNYRCFLKSAYIIYIELPKTFFEEKQNVNIINKIAYEDRDKRLEKVCDYKLSLNGKHQNKAVNEIINFLKEVAV